MVMPITVCSPGVPPAFSLKGDMRDEAVDGGIYYNSAVAGFASLMVDTGRTIRCYSATGCGKAALICFLSEPTLVEGKKPIRWVLKLGGEILYDSITCVRCCNRLVL